MALKFPKLAKLFANKMKTGRKQCVLMFTPPIADNVLILGMPMFRNYYVTFDRWHHRVNFAAHNGKCGPAKNLDLHQTSNVPKLQNIDVRKIRYSHTHQKLIKE